MRSLRLVVSTLLLVPAITACSGGGSKDHPDAFVVVADVPIDNPPPPPGCDYGELRDDSNDDAATTGSPEATMLNFTGTTVLCGKINSTHFTPPMTVGNLGKVDADAFTVTVAADSQIYVSLSGAGLEALGRAEVVVYSGAAFDVFEGSAPFFTNHGAVSVGLAAGTYEFYVRAYNTAAATTDVSYKVKLTTDMPDTRCAHLTTGGYVEAHDNANNLGNDMIAWDDNAVAPAVPVTFTAITTDVPEPSLLTIAPAMSYRMSGVAALNADVGTYKDRDTFEFTTGATTNEVAIRTDYTGTADLDIAMLQKPAAGATTVNILTDSRHTHLGPDTEYLVTAVKPNTAYWIWVGAYMGSTTAAPYDTTICGVNFTPP